VVAALDHAGAIRRWAAAILGGSGMRSYRAALQSRLSDASAIVRRPQVTPSAIWGCTEAGRCAKPWRIARSLCGGEPPGSSMRLAIRLQWNPATCSSTKAFDVRVEMLAAIERIEGRSETYVDAHRQGCWVVEFTNRSSLIAFKVCCSRLITFRKASR